MNNYTIDQLDKTIDEAAVPFLVTAKVLALSGDDDDEEEDRFQSTITPRYAKVGLLLYAVGFFVSVNHLLDKSLGTSVLSYIRNIHHNFISDSWEPDSNPSSKENFLLGIFSENNEEGAKRREIVREKYIKKRGGEHVCSLGQYLEANRAGNDIPCQVAYTFIVGQEGHDMGPRHECPDCTFLKVDDAELDEKGLAFVQYAASMPSAWAHFDNIAKMDDDSAYLTFLSSIVEDWGLANNSISHKHDKSSTGPLKNSHMLEFVDAKHSAGSTNNLVYGSPYIPTHRNSMFNRGQVYFMTLDLAKYISTRMDQNASVSWLKSHLLSNLKPKQKIDTADFLLRKKKAVAVMALA